MARKKAKKRTRRSSPLKGLRGLIKVFGKVMPFLVMIGIVGAVFLGMRNMLYSDQHLQIKMISIEPPLSLSGDMRKELENRYLGKNLLSVNLNKLARDIEKDPSVKGAAVFRRFPSYLQIRVDKREPFAYLMIPSKKDPVIISSDAFVLGDKKANAPELMTMEPKGFDKMIAPAGKKVIQKDLLSAIQFATQYKIKETEESLPISKLSFDVGGNVSVYFKDSPEVRLGRFPQDRIHTLSKVFHLLKNEESKKIEYIDIQYDNVIVKKKR